MARPLRFLLKKRGDRRTGSTTAANWGTLLIALVLLLFGFVFFVVLLWLIIIPEWQVNHQFEFGQATVRDKKLAVHNDEGITYRIDITIDYDVAGQTLRQTTYDIIRAYSSGRRGKQQVLDRFIIGQQYPCWYDPAKPERVVLVQGYTWWLWLMLLIPLAFLVSGVWLVVRTIMNWSLSPERLADQVNAQTTRLFPSQQLLPAANFPAIPSDENIVNSPGTTLRYRLPINVSAWWTLLGSLMVMIFWNGIVSIFVYQVIAGWLQGDAPWFMTLFMLPFLGVGIYLIYAVLNSAMIAFGVGPTVVEISEHPLHPDQDFLVWVSQAGKLTMQRLKVDLICEELATFRQGTDTRTETRVVFEQELFQRVNFRIDEVQQFAEQFLVTIPDTAMHSFKAANNEIIWKIVVRGEITLWPDYERSFSIIVQPDEEEHDEPVGERIAPLSS